MKYSRIAGTGSYLPEKILTNAELEKKVATTNEWIVERTGIRERRIIGPNDSTASMAAAAAKQALLAAEMVAKDIQLIIVDDFVEFRKALLEGKTVQCCGAFPELLSFKKVMAI